jgi:class 3 adenylate cyclase
MKCPRCQQDNPAHARFCLGCGARPLPAKDLAEKILTSKAALEGERKQVTVLFADLKGSMELLVTAIPRRRASSSTPCSR